MANNALVTMGVLDNILSYVKDNILNEVNKKTITTEPIARDIPVIHITGEIPTTKKYVKGEIEYISKTNKFKAYTYIKLQGTSSLQYPKKNFTIKLYKDEARTLKANKEFKNWGAHNNFVLKADYIDITHARNVVGANIWSQMVKSRSDYNTLPEELRNSPNNGAIDGFIVKVYINNKYEGLYNWTIPKDAWMFGMNKNDENHVVLCAETNDNGDPSLKFNPCNFNKAWSGVDGQHWSIEVGNTTAVKTVNQIYKYVRVENADGLEDGKQYLIIFDASSQDKTDRIVTPTIIQNSEGTRKGFGCVESSAITDNDIIEVNETYTAYEFTLEKSGSNWKIKTPDGKYAYMYSLSERYAISLNDTGHDFSIGYEAPDASNGNKSDYNSYSLYVRDVSSGFTKCTWDYNTSANLIYADGRTSDTYESRFVFYKKTAVNENITSSFNRIYESVYNGSIALEECLDVQSMIDYFIFQDVMFGVYGLAKNMLMITYDMTKWYLSAYDLDSICGLYWDGSTIFDSYDIDMGTAPYANEFSELINLLRDFYWDEYILRYKELRSSVLSTANIVKLFEDYINVYGEDLWIRDTISYPDIPSITENNFINLQEFIKNRVEYLDDEYLT